MKNFRGQMCSRWKYAAVPGLRAGRMRNTLGARASNMGEGGLNESGGKRIHLILLNFISLIPRLFCCRGLRTYILRVRSPRNSLNQ